MLKSLVASEVINKDLRELRVLDRVLSWRTGGIQLEADPRHQEIRISEFEQGVRGLSTPGVKNPQRTDVRVCWIKLKCIASDRQEPVRATSRWTDQI